MDIYLVQYKAKTGWRDYTDAAKDWAIEMAKDYHSKRLRGYRWRCVHRTDAVVWEPNTEG